MQFGVEAQMIEICKQNAENQKEIRSINISSYKQAQKTVLI